MLGGDDAREPVVVVLPVAGQPKPVLAARGFLAHVGAHIRAGAGGSAVIDPAAGRAGLGEDAFAVEAAGRRTEERLGGKQ